MVMAKLQLIKVKSAILNRLKNKKRSKLMSEDQPQENQPVENLQTYMKSKGFDDAKVLELLKGMNSNEAETSTEQEVPENKAQEEKDAKESGNDKTINVKLSDLQSIIDKSVQKALKGERKENPKPKPADKSFNSNMGMIESPFKQKKIEQKTRPK